VENDDFEEGEKREVLGNCRDFNKTYLDFGLKSAISAGLSMCF